MTRLIRHLRRDIDPRRAERPAVRVVHLRGVREHIPREDIRERRLDPAPLRGRVRLALRRTRQIHLRLRVANRDPALIPDHRGLQLVLHLRSNLVRHDVYVLEVKVRVRGLFLLRPLERRWGRVWGLGRRVRRG